MSWYQNIADCFFEIQQSFETARKDNKYSVYCLYQQNNHLPLPFSIADIDSVRPSCCHQLLPFISVSAVFNNLLETDKTAKQSND